MTRSDLVKPILTQRNGKEALRLNRDLECNLYSRKLEIHHKRKVASSGSLGLRNDSKLLAFHLTHNAISQLLECLRSQLGT